MKIYTASLGGISFTFADFSLLEVIEWLKATHYEDTGLVVTSLNINYDVVTYAQLSFEYVDTNKDKSSKQTDEWLIKSVTAITKPV